MGHRQKQDNTIQQQMLMLQMIQMQQQMQQMQQMQQNQEQNNKLQQEAQVQSAISSNQANRMTTRYGGEDVTNSGRSEAIYNVNGYKGIGNYNLGTSNQLGANNSLGIGGNLGANGSNLGGASAQSHSSLNDADWF